MLISRVLPGIGREAVPLYPWMFGVSSPFRLPDFTLPPLMLLLSTNSVAVDNRRGPLLPPAGFSRSVPLQFGNRWLYIQPSCRNFQQRASANMSRSIYIWAWIWLRYQNVYLASDRLLIEVTTYNEPHSIQSKWSETSSINTVLMCCSTDVFTVSLSAIGLLIA